MVQIFSEYNFFQGIVLFNYFILSFLCFSNTTCPLRSPIGLIPCVPSYQVNKRNRKSLLQTRNLAERSKQKNCRKLKICQIFRKPRVGAPVGQSFCGWSHYNPEDLVVTSVPVSTIGSVYY